MLLLVGMWFTGLWGFISVLLRFTGSTVDMKISYQVTKYRAMYVQYAIVQCIRSRCTNTISRYSFNDMHFISMYSACQCKDFVHH